VVKFGTRPDGPETKRLEEGALIIKTARNPVAVVTEGGDEVGVGSALYERAVRRERPIGERLKGAVFIERPLGIRDKEVTEPTGDNHFSFPCFNEEDSAPSCEKRKALFL
jgi:hypothetical protein